MKKTNIYVLGLFLAAKFIPMSAIAQGDPVPYALSIRADDLKKHLTFIEKCVILFLSQIND